MSRNLRINRIQLPVIWKFVTWGLWAGLVLTLPFSSLPLVARFTGSSAVAPGSLVFLLPLLALFLPSLFSKQRAIPFHFKLMLGFLFFALLTVGAVFFRFIPDYKSQSLEKAAVEGILTLLIGAGFYLSALTVPNSSEKLARTMRILNWAGTLLIVWSIAQILVKLYVPGLRPVMNEIQGFVSLTRILKTRMVGFAYEPSWLAHMLNLTFLPFWLSATINRNSVHRFRIWKFTLENFLLLGGVVVLVGTFSRAGLAAFMLVVFLLFVLANYRLIRKLSKKWNLRKRWWLTALLVFMIILIYLLVLVLGLFVLSKVDPRMEAVFQVTSAEQSPLVQYADELQFGERVVYWQTGWNIFNDHPIFGVGMGFSGFYFPANLPDIGWELAESRDLLYRSPGLMNIKNLWVRLLAETGIIGLAFFVTLLVFTLITCIQIARKGSKSQRMFGFSGIFMLTALTLEGFSVDSFALPYLWFTLGLVTAGWRWGNELEKEDNGSF